MGGHAAEQVHLVGVGGGDEQVGLPDPRLLQGGHGGAVALNAHYVVLLHGLFQDQIVQVDEGQVVALGAELTGQGEAHLAVACDDDVHVISLQKKKIFPKLLIYQYSRHIPK